MRVRYGGFGSPGTNMTPIWVIMAVNALVFVATLVSLDRVIPLLGFTPFQFLDEPWTIVTSMFVHASMWHILGNMLMLYFFGSYLLGLVGERKFLLVYFAGGLLGNVLFWALGANYATVVGASGALFAVMGTMAVMRPRLKVLIWFMIPADLWIVVAIGALIIAPNTAWQAHLGGLALGLVAGFIFRRRERGAFWR